MCHILAVFFPVQGLVPDPDPSDGIVPVPVTVDHTDTHEGAVADDLSIMASFIFLFFSLDPTHLTRSDTIAQVKSTPYGYTH